MRKVQILFLLAVLLLVVSAPVACADDGRQTTLLLSPSGQPVGGVWQQWMNKSYMPTYSGSMVLDLNSSNCGYTGFGTVAACSNRQPFTPVSPQVQTLPETTLNLSSFINESRAALLRHSKWDLLYEQAHIVDFEDLTDEERATFAALWGRPVPAGMPVYQWWMQGDQTNAYGALNEWFAYDYMICAVWPKLTWAILDYNGWVIGWGESDPVSLGTPLNLFPVLTDVRDEGGLVVNGKYKGIIVYPPTRRDEQILLKQQRSCDMIRPWVTAATPAA